MPSDQLLSISWWQVISDEMIYHGNKWFLMRWYIMVTSYFWWDDISSPWYIISSEITCHHDISSHQKLLVTMIYHLIRNHLSPWYWWDDISWWQVISDEMIYHGDKLFLMRWYIMVTSYFWWDDISWWQVISDEMIYHSDKLFLMRWYIMVTSDFWWASHQKSLVTMIYHLIRNYLSPWYIILSKITCHHDMVTSYFWWDDIS
jgi:hypothetical protein